MKRIAVVLVLAQIGCGSVSSNEELDAAPSVDSTAVDAPPSIEVAHVPEAGEYVGGQDLVVSGTTVLDTDQLTLGGLPADMDVHAQEGGGPEIAVLHVLKLTVESSAVIDVVGARPLVVIAGDEISIIGQINASSNLDQSSGAGSDPAGPGAGVEGNSGAQGGAGGGAGGGFAVAGGNGGLDDDGTQGGAGGMPHGDPNLVVLRAGGWGGGGACEGGANTPAGRGGGALHLFSTVSVTIAGFVSANGGGGRGAVQCDPGGGGGGGAGGAIYVSAPAVTISGVVTANGGGGGGGSSNLLGNGLDGQNGLLTGDRALGGRNGNNGSFGMGGQGGALAGPPSDGLTGSATPGGGGGGGAQGRIVIASPAASLVGTISPAPAMPAGQ